MKVVIRTDAALQIGTGHVMRCLTLANALSEQGAEVQFICRKHTGNLITYIQSKGYLVYMLETTKATSSGDSQTECDKELQLFHANWLGVTQEKDAQECKPIIQKFQPDWLVVDHYSIDKVWQTELKGAYQKLMVIDDLADRHHQCDLLLDQTYGRLPQDYQGLVPANCQMLLGSQYALLRPEFAQWRDFSLNRREQPQFKNLLITMGGVDSDGVTGRVLDVLETCNLPKDLEIIVVMGAAAPHLDVVRAQAEAMSNKTQVKTSVNNMAEIMANADLAIGAVGATTWERCCLGLPTIMMPLADNQIYAAEKLSNNNIGWVVFSVIDIKKVIHRLLGDSKSILSEVTKASMSLTDGCGVKYACNIIINI